MKVVEGKLVVLGNQGVGKTSVILSYTTKKYNTHVNPTIGASYFFCSVNLDDYRLKIQVWDTAGQERFRAMAPMYYRNANAAFLVFDISSYHSFLGMKSWLEELRKNVDNYVYLCILGNKRDLESSRQVKTQEAKEYADMVGASYVETSAVSNEGIEHAFVTLSNGLIEMVKSGNDSTLRVIDSERSRSQPSTSTSASFENSVILPSNEPLKDHSSCC
ncbi:Ras-protein Rab-21 [Chamberlinius hualienensis]